MTAEAPNGSRRTDRAERIAPNGSRRTRGNGKRGEAPNAFCKQHSAPLLRWLLTMILLWVLFAAQLVPVAWYVVTHNSLPE